jgi:penicillin-binding protein 2
VFSVAQDEEYEVEDVPEHLRHHALFVAYAPAENPEIALAVIVEHGGGGSAAAAPVARKVLDAYMLSHRQ